MIDKLCCIAKNEWRISGDSKSLYCAAMAVATTTWKSAREIGEAIGYNHVYLSTRIIPRMLKDGLLEVFDKNASKSPVQKYRATAKGKKNV